MASYSRWKTASSFAIGLALCLVAGRYLAAAFDPSWRDFGEGPLLATVEQFRAEPCSPRWLSSPPYTLSPYGPGYFVTVASFSGMTPWQGTLVPGRLVALAAVLGLVAVIIGTVTRWTRHLLFGLFAGLMFLVSSVVASWTPFHRVDTLAVLFSVAACAAASSDRRRGLIAAAILIAAGSLVKQTAALTALPIFIYLLLSRRFAWATGFAVLTTALGAGLWLAIDFLSEGYCLTMALRGVINRPAVEHGLRLALGFLQSPSVLAGLLVAGWLLKNAPREAVSSLFFVAFVLSTLLALASGMKEGASINYYLEPCAYAALVVGVHGLPRWNQAQTSRLPISLGVVGLLLAIPGVGDFPGASGRSTWHTDVARQVEQTLDHSPNHSPVWVLADGPWVDTALAAGARPMVNDPYVYRLLVDNGTLTAEPLIAAMRSGHVPWLLLYRPIERHRQSVGTDVQRWPAEVIEAMERLYVLAEGTGDAWIYQYKPPSPLGGLENGVDLVRHAD